MTEDDKQTKNLDDMMAKIVAGRTNRTIVRVFQNLATAIFIPLSFIPK